jgi:hypothetical protein
MTLKRLLLAALLMLSASCAHAAISEIGTCNGTTSCTAPTHKPGDLFVAYAGVNLTATAPTNPAGWTSVGTSSINGTSTADSAVRVSCKVASSAAETITGFTSATSLIVVVYRGADVSGASSCGAVVAPVFFTSTVNTTSTTETFSAHTNADSNSWDVGFGYAPAATAGIGTAPTGMTNRATQGTVMGAHDTNGGVASFSSANVTLTTAGRIITAVVEIKAEAALTACSGTCPIKVQDRDWGTNAGGRTGSLFKFHLPQPTLSGNLLACGVSWDGGGTVTATITDNNSQTWSHGPSATSSSTRNIKIDYLLPAAAGTQDLTLTLSVAEFNVHMRCTEFANISAVDVAGTAATAIGGATSVTANKPGSFTTTQANDLIYMYGVDDSNLNNGTAQAVNNLTIAGTNYSLGSVDTWSPRFGAWIAWGGSGAINPATMIYQSSNGTARDQWNVAAMSFKSSATGTAPSGMYIAREFSTSPPQSGTGATIQVPCDGHLFVATGSTTAAQFDLYSGKVDGTSSWSDSDSNTYSTLVATGAPQILYAANATCTNPNQRTVSVAWTNHGSPDPIEFYDIVGAASSPLDTSATTSTSGATATSGFVKSGSQSQAHYATGSATCSNSANSNTSLNFTPSTSSGLAIVVDNNGQGPDFCDTGTAGNVVDNAWMKSMDDACCGSMNSSSGYGHIFYSSSSQMTYTSLWSNAIADPSWTADPGPGTAPGSSYYMGAALFKAASGANNASPSETVTSSPAIAVSVGRSAAAAVTVTTAPAVALSAGRTASVPDSVSSSPALAVSAGRSASDSETVTTASAVTAAHGFNPAIADSATSSPAVTAVAAHNAAQADSVTTAPAVATSAGRSAAEAESVTNSPAVNAAAGRSAALADSATTAPAVTATQGHGAPIADSVTNAPAVATLIGRNVAIADSETTAPAVTAAAGYHTAIADAVTTAPAVTAGLSRAAAIADSVTTAPAVSAQQGRGAPLSDGFTSSPAVTTQLGFHNTVADSLTSASALAVLAAHAQPLADSATAAPSVAVMAGRSAAPADSLSSSPAVALLIGRMTAAADSVTTAPAVATKAGRMNALADGFTSGDAVAVSVHRSGTRRRVLVVM